MFPAQGTQTGFFIYMQTQRDDIIGEYLAARRDTVTQRSIQVKENGFYIVRFDHMDMLLRI